MSSFKRREPGTRAHVSSSAHAVPAATAETDTAANANEAAFASGKSDRDGSRSKFNGTSKLPTGLRPSPFPSPLPLFSTGLASLDDFLTGHGLPSSSLFALCPSTGLTSLEISAASDQGQGAAHDKAPAASERRKHANALGSTSSNSRMTLEALRAAEDTLLDLMSYGAAQGVIAGHEVLIIGNKARHFATQRMPSRAVGRGETVATPSVSPRDEMRAAKDEKQSDTSGEVTQDSPNDGSEAMKIAFRYAHRPKFKTTVEEPVAAVADTDSIPEEHRFRAPFDQSKRWRAEDLASAEQTQQGRLSILDTTRYEEAWQVIEKATRNAQHTAQNKSTDVSALRIHLLSLGSSMWTRPGESLEHRLVHLSRFLIRLRRLLRTVSTESDPATHAVCTFTVSPDLLAPPWQMVVTHHLLRLADCQMLLSDFTHDAHLKRAYSGYGGSVALLKGPSIGGILPPGERRSVLRGGGGEAGAENDVGWRRRPRGRGIVLETLHEDVDADLKKSENDAARDAKAKTMSQGKQRHGDDIEEAALGLVRKPRADAGLPSEHTHDHSPSSHSGRQTNHESGMEHNTHGSKSPGRVPPRFEGLKTLRERGLRASKPVSIDVEQEE